MAYKEVNFKSKLIEWTQKNRIQMSFRLEDQSKDQNGSPTFKYTVVLETIDGSTGVGFSKKESQQHACEDTLKRLKKDSAYLDSIFAAKTERTKMEEEPVLNVPDTEEKKDDFIVVSSPKDMAEQQIEQLENSIDEEMDLSDVTAEPKEPTREDIIAAAEAEAYEENNVKEQNEN
jgi:ribonuclease-3